MRISPFSLEHDWSLNWRRVPSNFRADPRIKIHSMKERKALEAIASVGVIGEKQLSRLFSLTEDEINHMQRQFKIMKHHIKRNNKDIIPIYTLHVRGAMALKMDAYEPNYWTRYFGSDVLKSLLFFQVYHFFPTLKILPALEPFVASVKSNDNLIHVYVLKGSSHDLMQYLKWNKNNRHRLMIITESLTHMTDLELFLEDMKVRIVLEDDLMTKNKIKQDIFYVYNEQGELVR